MAKVDELPLVEKLADVESYQVWKFKISVILKANGLYQTVTEEIVEARLSGIKKILRLKK